MDFSKLGKKNSRGIHGIKNHLILISVHEEIKEQI